VESTEQEVEVEDEQKQYHSGKEASWEKAGTSHCPWLPVICNLFYTYSSNLISALLMCCMFLPRRPDGQTAPFDEETPLPAEATAQSQDVPFPALSNVVCPW